MNITDEDAISRKVVKAEYKRKLESNLKDEERGVDLTEFADCTEFNKFIDSIPPVKPQEPETGRWIEHEIKGICRWLTCSVCGYEWVNKKENFCPNCGKRMVESEDK